MNMAIKWFPSSIHDPFPRNVVAGGYESDGSPIYVGRASMEGTYLPVKVIPNKRKAFISWLGVEYDKTHYELLVGDNYSWQHCDLKSIPENAISTGSVGGEAIYIGRGHYESGLTVGKIMPSHGCLYIPFNGKEVRLLNFEILIYFETPKELTKSEASKFSPVKELPVPVFQVTEVRALPFCEPNYSRYQQQPQPSSSLPQGGPASSSNPNQSLATVQPEYDTWVLAKFDNTPAHMVHAGYDIDEKPMFVARAFHSGDYIPGKAFPSCNLACIPFGGQEIVKSTFEYLTGENYIWMSPNPFPAGAVVVNPISTNEHLYVGRTNYSGSLLCGKFKRSENRLYVPFDRREIPITSSIEILVHRGRHASANQVATSSQN